MAHIILILLKKMNIQIGLFHDFCNMSLIHRFYSMNIEIV